MTLSISDNLVKEHENIHDQLIQDLGVDCDVHYLPEKQACDDCSASGTLGAQRLGHGGPAPTHRQICPTCNGQGFKEVEPTPTTIKLRVFATTKEFRQIGATINAPDADLRVIGQMKHLPKLRKMKELVVVSNKSAFRSWRFTLASEPFPYGFKKRRYFVAELKRAG